MTRVHRLRAPAGARQAERHDSRPTAIWLAAALLVLAVPAMAGQVTELSVGGKGGAKFADDGSRDGYCMAGDLFAEAGTLFDVSSPVLQPGDYIAHVRLKLSHPISEYTACYEFTLQATTIHGNLKTPTKRVLTAMDFESPGTYQKFAIPLRVDCPGSRVKLTLTWGWKGATDETKKKPIPLLDAARQDEDGKIEGMLQDADELKLERELGELEYHLACDRLRLERIGSASVCNLAVDKIRYRPGQTAEVSGKVRNYRSTPASLELLTQVVREMDDVETVETRQVNVPGLSSVDFQVAVPLDGRLWGHEVRCVLIESGSEIARASEYFTVHDNIWAVQVCAPATRNTRGISPEQARATAMRCKQGYANQMEFVFWAPCDFSDFNPGGDFYGGQMRFVGGAAGTKALVAACREVGIACAVYAKMFTPGGKAGYENLRRHPEWFSPAVYDVAQMDRWDRSERMNVWPWLSVRADTDGPFEHHAKELIDSISTFGWELVRYDSHMVEAEAPRAYRLVRDRVNQAHPNVQWGNNDGIHMGKHGAKGMYELMCENGGMIMEEYVRNVMAGEKWPYERFADYHLRVRDEVHSRGGYVNILRTERLMPSDRLYETILALATRAHSGGDRRYDQFATRYAGYVWDNQARQLEGAQAAIDWGKAANRLFKWPSYTYLRPRDANHSELILQMVNKPASERFGVDTDCRVPEPLSDVSCSIKIPDGLTVRDVWIATAEPALSQEKLPFEVKDGRLTFTVKKLRFWNMVVIRLEGTGQWN